jgi:hypothetical protein
MFKCVKWARQEQGRMGKKRQEAIKATQTEAEFQRPMNETTATGELTEKPMVFAASFKIESFKKNELHKGKRKARIRMRLSSNIDGGLVCMAMEGPLNQFSGVEVINAKVNGVWILIEVDQKQGFVIVLIAPCGRGLAR